MDFCKRGKWIVERRERFVGILDGFLCSECGEWHAGHIKYPYCPYCGAKMDDAENTSDVHQE